MTAKRKVERRDIWFSRIAASLDRILCRPDREPRDIAFYSAVSPARRAPTLTESQERGAKRRRMAALFLFLNLLISPFNPARWLEAEDTVL